MSAEIDQHLSQWRRNRSFVSVIPESNYEWSITAVFYTAIHLIDAVLAAEGMRPTNHEQRKDYLNKVRNFDLLRRQFHTLYNLARVVRYTPDPAEWVSQEDVEKRVIRGIYMPLENSALKLINRLDLKLEPPKPSWVT
jgi:hypothetical protein